MRSSLVTLNTVALELVPPNAERGQEQATEEARKVRQFSAESGIDGRIRHVMIPGMIAEEDDRPVEMKPKLDVLEFWSAIKPELSGVNGLCTQVTAFMDEPSLRRRLTDLVTAGIEGIVFVGVPRTMNDGEGSGVAPTDALSIYRELVANRGAILIPTRDGEHGRFNFKCDQGATFGLTQLLYSDAIVGFLTEFAKNSDHRPEILLSFGFVPKVENRVGLINWLIQDPGNAAVAAEQALVSALANSEPARRRQMMVDLYKRVIDGVVDLGGDAGLLVADSAGPGGLSRAVLRFRLFRRRSGRDRLRLGGGLVRRLPARRRRDPHRSADEAAECGD
jgi:Mycobacterial methylenetetrahydrofolate reductase